MHNTCMYIVFTCVYNWFIFRIKVKNDTVAIIFLKCCNNVFHLDIICTVLHAVEQCMTRFYAELLIFLHHAHATVLLATLTVVIA